MLSVLFLRPTQSLKKMELPDLARVAWLELSPKIPQHWDNTQVPVFCVDARDLDPMCVRQAVYPLSQVPRPHG